MGYPSCLTLTNLTADCAAVRKVGGVTARVWIGKKANFRDAADGNNPAYFEYGNAEGALDHNAWYLLITDEAIGLSEIAYFEGVQLKNNGSFEAVPGPNVNVFNHIVNLVLFNYTQDSIKNLQNLLLSDDLFCVMLTEAGDFVVYGFNYDVNNLLTDRLGLKTVSGAGGDIAELQGEVGYVLQLNAEGMEKLPFIMEGVYSKRVPTYSFVTEIPEVVDILNLLPVSNV